MNFNLHLNDLTTLLAQDNIQFCFHSPRVTLVLYEFKLNYKKKKILE